MFLTAASDCLTCCFCVFAIALVSLCVPAVLCLFCPSPMPAMPLEGVGADEWVMFDKVLIVRDLFTGGNRSFTSSRDAREFRAAVYQHYGELRRRQDVVVGGGIWWRSWCQTDLWGWDDSSAAAAAVICSGLTHLRVRK